MQNYGGSQFIPYVIRTIASGCHNNRFVLVVNHIPNFLQKQTRVSFSFSKTNKTLQIFIITDRVFCISDTGDIVHLFIFALENSHAEVESVIT